jgi:hypothetical protein
MDFFVVRSPIFKYFFANKTAKSPLKKQKLTNVEFPKKHSILAILLRAVYIALFWKPLPDEGLLRFSRISLERFRE